MHEVTEEARRQLYGQLAADLEALRRREAIAAALAACGLIVAAAQRTFESLGRAFAEVGRRMGPALRSLEAAHAADPELMHIWGGLGAWECEYCRIHRRRHREGPEAFHAAHGIDPGRCWWCRESMVLRAIVATGQAGPA